MSFVVQDKFTADADVNSIRLGEQLPPYQSANTQSIGELFAGFLKYYAHDFK
jgi:hypothetical protein